MTRPPTILLALVAALCALLASGLLRATEPPTLTDRIDAVLQAERRHKSDLDEDPRDRAARLREVATAVSAAVRHARCEAPWTRESGCRPIWGGDSLELAAAVLALGRHETHWASAVQAGRCSDLGRLACDRGRARGPWQAWQRACPALHAAEPGSDAALRAGAWCAVRLLSGAARFCANRGEPPNWPGAFRRYGGAACYPGNERRAAAMRGIWAALRRAGSQPP